MRWISDAIDASRARKEAVVRPRGHAMRRPIAPARGDRLGHMMVT